MAIDLSGLGLARVKDRLDTAGASVSVTTLSYWRSGRAVPTRRESRRAVELLETVLGLPARSLTDLLDRSDARRVDLPGRVLGQERLWGTRSRVAPFLATLGDQNISLPVLDLRESLEVDADRFQRRHRIREVVRATADLVCTKLITTMGTPGRPPKLIGTRYCEPGRVETLPEEGFRIIELALPRPLSRGETAILEYELEYDDERPNMSCNRLFRHAVHTHLLEITFAPEAQPLACRSYRLAVVNAPEIDVTPLTHAPGAPFHVYSTEVSAGVRGVGWEWP
ncbi:hypothetical protein [Amycolatopsis sp. CA-128772]|uniref:hypothetical protein n=1 Tax=Amycolatopsis sp. CA-128772 TaxID=2073159 RepID=UPI001E44653B|nr:hypothetical protein [Amycolatopsis sp. CA-128772]